jgi:hypothetical protein
LEDEVQKFVTDIQHWAWEATPLITTKVRGNTCPREIREKIAENRKVRKRWKMTRDPRIKTELNHLNQGLRRAILDIKQQAVEQQYRISSSRQSNSNTGYQAAGSRTAIQDIKQQAVEQQY